MLLFDLAEFTLDFAVIFRDAVEFGHCRPGFLHAAFTIGIAWRFREEEDAHAEDERPNEPDTHWYSPGARVWTLLSAKIDGVRGKYTRCDKKLVCTHECSAHLAGACFAGVHGHHYGESANPSTGNQSTNCDLNPGGFRGHLYDDADDEDN